MNAPTAEEHLGLVHLCANRFRGRGMEYEDLYSAGCIGLLKAVKAFDCTRGVQFSTYAVPVILGEIKRLFRDGGAVKVSRSLKEHAMQIQQLQEQFQQKHGRAATLTELAERSGLSEEIIAESLCAAQPPLSLTTAAEEAPWKFLFLHRTPNWKICLLCGKCCKSCRKLTRNCCNIAIFKTSRRPKPQSGLVSLKCRFPEKKKDFIPFATGIVVLIAHRFFVGICR